jgi:hypothetical protein
METHLFIGKILAENDQGRSLMEVRNKCQIGDPVEILSSGQSVRNTCIKDMRDDQGNSIQVAQPGARVYPDLGLKTHPNDLVRRVIYQSF